MLHQVCLEDIRSGKISRKNGHIAVTMHHYPRGVKRELMDEYISLLAPDEDLLKDFLHHKKDLAESHNAAFETSHYQSRFGLSVRAVTELQRLSEMSKRRDVYIVCQCESGERCHREMLLLLANKWYGAQIDKTHHDYSEFLQRVPEKPRSIPAGKSS
jgi:uncharacterized protein YeaO (DUF488 family)